MWNICLWTCGKEVFEAPTAAVFRLYNRLFSPSIPVGLEADTLQVDLFDLLEEGGGYVVGMFSHCSSVQCNLSVSMGPFDLCCSWVFTPDCQDSCWDTQLFNRMYSSQSLRPYELLHKEVCYHCSYYISKQCHSLYGWLWLSQCKTLLIHDCLTQLLVNYV